MARKLTAEDARRKIPLNALKQEVKNALPADFIGQERAQKALDLGLSPRSTFHIMVVGENIAPQAIRDYVAQKVQQRKQQGESFPVYDWCYVYNFQDPISPALLRFPPGEGKIFRNAVKTIWRRLIIEIPDAIESVFKEKVKAVWREILEAGKERLQIFLEQSGILEEWKAKGWTILVWSTEEDIQIGDAPVDQNGNVLKTNEEINAFMAQLSPEEKIQREQARIALLNTDFPKITPVCQQILNECQTRFHQIELPRIQDGITKTRGAIATKAIEKIFKIPLTATEYKEPPEVNVFLRKLKSLAERHKEIFYPQPALDTQISPSRIRNPELERIKMELSRIFEVNLFVENKADGPPILIELHPTYGGLFGKIEKRLIVADGRNNEIGVEDIGPDNIKPGAFHRAMGGFIILNLDDILATKHPVYLGLKRVLEENKLRILDYYEEMGLTSEVKTIRPEPMPLDLKVILIVKPQLYHLLWQFLFDRDLMKTVAILAEFSTKNECTPENISAYSNWIDEYAKIKQFPSFTLEAKALLLEALQRLTENQDYLLHDIETLKDIIKEAANYALEEKSEDVKAYHVRKALQERIYRSNLIEQEIQEAIKTGKILIQTSGKVKGQINALFWVKTGNYSFGVPGRVTVTTYKGQKGLIDIQKEADLSGNTTVLGVQTLQGFFYERYGGEGFSGRVTFEQIYHKVEGPSATTAQLFALLSSLSGKPITQELAITGTVDQKGNIGSIGGVNEKIEGFFKVCKLQGLTGNQGVIIPESNAKNLMLEEEVVEAIKNGQFHIYTIGKVDEGIELLMGCSVKEVDELVVERLKKWSKKKRWLIF